MSDVRDSDGRLDVAALVREVVGGPIGTPFDTSAAKPGRQMFATEEEEAYDVVSRLVRKYFKRMSSDEFARIEALPRERQLRRVMNSVGLKANDDLHWDAAGEVVPKHISSKRSELDKRGIRRDAVSEGAMKFRTGVLLREASEHSVVDAIEQHVFDCGWTDHDIVVGDGVDTLQDGGYVFVEARLRRRINPLTERLAVRVDDRGVPVELIDDPVDVARARLVHESASGSDDMSVDELRRKLDVARDEYQKAADEWAAAGHVRGTDLDKRVRELWMNVSRLEAELKKAERAERAGDRPEQTGEPAADYAALMSWASDSGGLDDPDVREELEDLRRRTAAARRSRGPQREPRKRTSTGYVYGDEGLPRGGLGT